MRHLRPIRAVARAIQQDLADGEGCRADGECWSRECSTMFACVPPAPLSPDCAAGTLPPAHVLNPVHPMATPGFRLVLPPRAPPPRGALHSAPRHSSHGRADRLGAACDRPRTIARLGPDGVRACSGLDGALLPDQAGRAAGHPRPVCRMVRRPSRRPRLGAHVPLCLASSKAGGTDRVVPCDPHRCATLRLSSSHFTKDDRDSCCE